ncbi:phosphatidylcholine:ceramide cholinephosphotransferase 2-like [Hemicordylus capensis]|uniref:phosphatidylcholine:ceramide cholinephosphotransferase 2-like n=1 Tax=Hemicordylus capensis TaxID=884348 RepID=UPI002302E9C8|nr:phosphatidylcholine:ceramide cholinephosphotransferase 2-like [Hemicordylus capensis]
MDSRTLLPLDPPDCIFSSLGSRNSETSVQKRQKAVKIRVIDVGVRYPSEWYKTLTMLLYAGCSLLISSSLILLSNKWAPAKHATSPTAAFIKDANWVFEISKVTSFLLVALWLLQWFLLRYRSIVGRRFLFIIGTLHLYQSLIIYVMVLPIPSSDITSEEKFYEDWKLLLKQSLKIASADGLFQRSSVFCGIYMYGHASNLILAYLFIKAYSPGKFWVYHVLCWSLCVTGLVSAILLHAYNLLDLIVSYFMTTRLFWWYHTLANHKWLKKSSPPNYLASIWWFRIFVFCEENVLGTLPHSYSWPISCSVSQEKKQTEPKPNQYEA